MRLKRRHARIVLGLLAADVLFAGLLPLLSCWGAPMLLIKIDLCIIIVLSLLTPYLRMRLLLCPHCGRGIAIPHWKSGRGRAQFCAGCGRRLRFDDDPGEDED